MRHDALVSYTFVPEFTLGDRLQRARRSYGASQAKLAEELGVSLRAMSNYEQDHTIPPIGVLRAWANACQVSLPWLAFGDRDLPEPTYANWGKLRKASTRRSTIWYEEWSRSPRDSDNTLVAVS